MANSILSEEAVLGTQTTNINKSFRVQNAIVYESFNRKKGRDRQCYMVYRAQFVLITVINLWGLIEVWKSLFM
jgi:hypothetical protein